jgi:chromosome segregation ATPase
MKGRILVLVSVVVAASCATTEDPHEGGFFGGVHGLSSGAYERRVQERNERLDRLHAMQRELEEEEAGLRSDKSEREARLAGLHKRLGRLDRETVQLSRDLQGKRLTLESVRAERDRLERKLAGLRKEIAGLERRADSGASVRQLEAERDRLEEEYRTLLDLYLELGK